MDTGRTVDIPFLLSQEDIASSFLKHLPAGGLITLARTNSVLRAELHDFGDAHPQTTIATGGVRHVLQIGHHNTARWRKLKSDALHECSSPTHTKGDDVKPCRYCSRLICSACMARASFKNPGEKTFQNRTRSLCDSCWSTGNRHREQKITDECFCHTGREKAQVEGAAKAVKMTKTCECTNKNDGWVCLECKYLQNRVWSSSICFGEGCTNPLDRAAEKRRICMWCDKPLPITATRERPHVYKQKVVDAMAKEAASRQADVEGYAKRRRHHLRMTRRELRGEEEVLDDVAQYVRNLDTVNYTRLLGDARVPTSNQVYNSKQGRWQYGREFLLAFRRHCDAVSIPASVKDATKVEGNHGERTNKEAFEQRGKGKKKDEDRDSSDDDVDEWEELQEQIMRMRYIERRSARYIQDKLYQDNGLWATEEHYRRLTARWKRHAELESAGAKIPAQDQSRYWQDVGSSSAATTQDIHGARRSSGPPDALSAPEGTPAVQSRDHLVQQPSPIDTIPDSTAATTTTLQNDGAAGEDPMVLDRHSHGRSAARPGTAQILQDLQARQSDLDGRAVASAEETDQLLAEQAALQMEWEEALTVEADADMQADDSDDVNMLIAIQESVNEAPRIPQNESLPDGRPPLYFE